MWKAIKNYEGYYEVSDSGLIRSVDRYVKNAKGKHAGEDRFLRGAIMKQSVSTGRNHDGYYVVNLHKNGVSEVCLVHVLVAQAFLPNTQNLPTVNQILNGLHSRITIHTHLKPVFVLREEILCCNIQLTGRLLPLIGQPVRLLERPAYLAV